MILYGFTRHGVQCMSHMNCFYGAFYSFSELDGSRPHSWYGGADMINDQMTFFLKLPFKSHFKNHFKSSSVLLQPHWPMWVFHVRCPSESVLEDVNIISGKCLSEDIYKVICNKYNSMKETIVTFTYSEKHISYIHSTSTFDKNITKQLFLFCPSNH